MHLVLYLPRESIFLRQPALIRGTTPTGDPARVQAAYPTGARR